MRIIWKYRDAEEALFDVTDEYGSPRPSAVRELSDAAWWSGVRYGVAASFMPVLFALIAIRYWP